MDLRPPPPETPSCLFCWLSPNRTNVGYAPAPLTSCRDISRLEAYQNLEGLASNFTDVHRFIQLAHEFVDLVDVPADLPPRTLC